MKLLINTTLSPLQHLFFFIFYLQILPLSDDHRASNEKNLILVTAGRSSMCRSCNNRDCKVESFCTCALITQYCHDDIVFPPARRIGGYINYCINCLIIEVHFVRAAAAVKSNIWKNNRRKMTLMRNCTFWIRIVLQLESNPFRVLKRVLYTVPIVFLACYSSALTACTYCTFKIKLLKFESVALPVLGERSVLFCWTAVNWVQHRLKKTSV